VIPIPPQFDAEHARRWHDRDAAESYRFRYTYPPETFEILLSLIAGPTGAAVLDVGCGTGNIARPLAPQVRRVDAVDFAAEMVSVGRGLPGGAHPHIRWQVARAEEAVLDPPYALIVGGQSLHWMDWRTIMPRFAAALSPGGVLAVVSVVQADVQPWDAAVKKIVDRYSTYTEYIPFDMIPAWEGAGLFRQIGERRTAPALFEQPVEEFIAGWHAASHLTRAHIDAASFDAEVRAVMRTFCPGGIASRPLVGHVLWGKPLAGHGTGTG